jgi:hypothetical protein
MVLDWRDEQTITHAVWVKACCMLTAHGVHLPSSLLQVCLDLRGVSQIIANDMIDIGKRQRRILLHDFFDGGAIV